MTVLALCALLWNESALWLFGNTTELIQAACICSRAQLAHALILGFPFLFPSQNSLICLFLLLHNAKVFSADTLSDSKCTQETFHAFSSASAIAVG